MSFASIERITSNAIAFTLSSANNVAIYSDESVINIDAELSAIEFVPYA